MAANLNGLDESQIKNLLLNTLSWRLGDTTDFPSKLEETYKSSAADSFQMLEILCAILDKTINYEHSSPDTILPAISPLITGPSRQLFASTAFQSREKCVSFCKGHAPSLSRVLYHDWSLGTQIATETLGRIARPVANITMRTQPPAEGKLLLPPLRSVSMDLGKDMIDALSSGFDRLQTQLVKIVQ